MADEQAPTATRTARVLIEPGLLSGRVVLDGQDVSNHVARVSYDHRAGSLPQVFLELAAQAAPASIECDAVVHVVQEVVQDQAAATLAFLEPIDPDELDRSVLAAMELGGPQTYGAAFLEVVRGWARGD